MVLSIGNANKTQNSMKRSILSVTILLLLTSGCGLFEIPKEMLQLDQRYIPVWLSVEQSDMVMAAQHFEDLEKQWSLFETQYASVLASSEDHLEIFRLLNQWLEEAKGCIRKGEVLCSRVKLDQFKFELQEMRRLWEFDYTLDYVWEFESSISQFVEIAADEKLQLLEWSEFMPFLKAMNESWLYLYDHNIDVDFLEWNTERVTQYQQLRGQIENRLECLNGLTEGAQLEEIYVCALEIRQLTFQMINLFSLPESSKLIL